MDAEQFEILSKKLDTIIMLLAQEKLRDKSKSDSILLLNQFGLDNAAIASIVGSTLGTVAVRISEAKKAKENKTVKETKVVTDESAEVSPT